MVSPVTRPRPWRLLRNRVIGLLHAYLIWPGDILVPYALCGILLLWWMRNRSARTLLVSAIAMLAIGAALAIVHGVACSSMSEADRAAELELMMPTREQALGHVDLMLGGYLRFVAGSAAGTFMFETMFFALFFFWRCGGMMLLGMSLYKSGFLEGRLSSSSTYARIALIATPVGLGLAFIGALQLDRVAYAMPIRAWLISGTMPAQCSRRSVTPRRSFGSSSVRRWPACAATWLPLGRWHCPITCFTALSPP